MIKRVDHRRAAIALAAMLPQLALGCAHTLRVHSALPERHTVIREQLVIASDFDLPKQHRLIDELTAQRSDQAVKLGLPTSDEPVFVYLFDTVEQFNKFMQVHYPDLPSRRAFFVESDTRLVVYAHWSDRVAEDLRHEVAHGYLHSVVPNLPLWLDEGLAEYFEVPRGRGGLNQPHVDSLQEELSAGRWRPDIARLESITAVEDLSQQDYAESWAWVHMLLEGDPRTRDILTGYLQHLRADGSAPPLSLAVRQRIDDPAAALVSHLTRLPSAR